MKPQSFAKLRLVKSAFGKDRKEPQLHSAEKGARSPKPHAQLEQTLRGKRRLALVSRGLLRYRLSGCGGFLLRRFGHIALYVSV
jgi:hypothetical protein